MEKIIEIDGLNVDFLVGKQQVNVIHELSLDIFENEVLAVIGETGCGKSVTGNAISRLLPDHAVVKGSIKYQGRELSKLSDKEFIQLRGENIAVIPQSPSTSLNPLMQVGRQVEECVDRQKNRKPAVSDRVKEMFFRLGMPRKETIVKDYPCGLSGGMCQRVLIAMGVITQPRLLIVDEPTKAIDWALRKEVTGILAEMKEDLNCSMMLITHDIPVARRLADRIAVMYCGEIVEIGTSEQVLDNPQHPYTQGLLAALPRNGFQTMRGFMPSFTDLASGCRFQERCGWCEVACRDNSQSFCEVDRGHMVRCCNWEQPSYGDIAYVD